MKVTDGSPIELRRVHPSDADALRTFYGALSPDSRRSRFLASGGAPDIAAARSFCTPDHMHDEGFVAIADGDRLVGHLCLAACGTDCVELGVAVADDWQGHGIGRRLFESALEWARDHGVGTIVASAFVDNSRVLKLLSSAPHPPSITWADGGIVDVVIPIRGPLPSTGSRPPYVKAKRAGPRGRKPVRPLRVVWRRTPPPARVAGD